MDRDIKLSSAVNEFVAAHRKLRESYRHTTLNFTLDGRLVGDIGEVIASEMFGIKLCETRTPGVDGNAVLKGRQVSVQVKATGSMTAGPAFTPGKGEAEHLIFLQFDFERGIGRVAYNGPEAPIRLHLPFDFKGTKRVALTKMVDAEALVDSADRLQRIA